MPPARDHLAPTVDRDLRYEPPARDPAPTELHLTVERVLDEDTVARFYPGYVTAFDDLLTRAPARHLLTRQEFAGEMSDPRIDKLIVWDGDEAIALTTLTTDLSAVPWISPDYYLARYPDAAARGALFYLGYTLVSSPRRRSQALVLMVDQVNRRLRESQGVVGFDVCGYNDAHGIGRHVRRLFGSSQKIERLDVQSYYAADYRPDEGRPS